MGVSDSNFDKRESHLRVLADQLYFTVEKNGDRFTLKRTVDVSEPVCESNLDLDEAEELLRAWELRCHGGEPIRTIICRQILARTALRLLSQQSTRERCRVRSRADSDA